MTNMIDSDEIITMLEDVINDAMKAYRYAYMLPDKSVAEEIQNQCNIISMKFIDIEKHIKEGKDD